MSTQPPVQNAAADRWQRLGATSVRAFHRYGTWLVSLTWWRFAGYSLLLVIMASIVEQLPPFSWTYTETVVDHGRASSARPRPAAPRAPSAPDLPPSIPAPSEPTIRITKEPSPAGGDAKGVDITIPGIVIDSKEKSIHKGGVNITFGDDGIHIRADEGEARHAPAAAASAAAASAAAQAAEQAAERAASQAAQADRRAEADAKRQAQAAAAAASDAVEIDADGQRIRIGVPAHADSGEVRDAINEARDAIVDQLKDAAEQQRDQAESARDAAAAHTPGGDGEDDGSGLANASGDHARVRTHTVRYGEVLPLLSVWWILGSVLLKITYKGRMQAEVKAAAATETAEAESLRRQVLEARMAMMQAQVEPHFLFNTLASIDHLIEFDPKRASQMQRNLISLLRASMPSMRTTESGLRPLELELAVVRPYLEILQVRMEERLTTELDVPDGLLSAEFPPMMIQTLVENAIKHGLEPKPEGGHLAVKAEIRHGKLCVTVSDTGLGFDAAAKGQTHGTGVGLANIRERLALLYGNKANLTIANHPAGGTIVTITVPYTTHTESEPEQGVTA